MSQVAAVQTGARRGLVMAMLKQGHGLKDVFVLPCAGATEQKKMLAPALEQIETFDLPLGALTSLLAYGLGEGLALGRMPAPGLMDLAEMLGPDTLAPRAGGAVDILGSLGAAEVQARLPAARQTALLKTGTDLIRQFDNGDSWFEDTGRETAVWKHLETRRDWWARHFALCAAVLKQAVGQPPESWLTCAAVARSVLEGRSVKRIPVMAAIAEMTLDADAAQ